MSTIPLEAREESPKIQLALQGGGAKICALLAAMHAVQTLHEKKVLRVTRIAGTSAGSVVACLFAAGIPFETARKTLKAIAATAPAEILGMFPDLSKPCMAAKVLRGKPFWSEEKLRKKLEAVFSDYNVHTLGDLEAKTGIKVVIVAADIVNAKPVVYKDPADPIVNCLVNSCAIPFFYRSASNSGPNAVVDGGICENLPVAQLKDEEAAYGPVVGISFKEWQAGREPKNFLAFSKALLDTSMNYSLQRAKTELPADRIHNIQTRFGTFDFEKALGEGLEGSYDGVKAEAHTWFTGFIASSLKPRDPRHSLSGDPWATADPALLSKNWAVYSAQHEPLKYEYVRCSLVVRANLGAEPDVIQYTLVFRPADEPLYCVSLALTPLIVKDGPVPLIFFGKSKWSVTDATSREVRTVELAALNPAKPEDREFIVHFLPPLHPERRPAAADKPEPLREPYMLWFQDLVGNAMPDLARGEKDELGWTPRRAKGSIGQVDLVLHVPEKLAEARMVAKRGREALGREMTEEELRCAEYRPPIGFRGLGWTTSGLKPDARLGVDVYPR